MPAGKLAVARMIADPCSAELVPGAFGDVQGSLLRLVDTFTGAATNTSGYIVWFPQYHTDGNPDGLTGSRKTNCFFLNTTNAASAPTNSAAAPFGGTPGTSKRDPAYAWVAGTNVADARTAAACLQLRYTGSTMNCSGTIAKLTNIPHDLFTAVGAATMPSVNAMLAYSRDIERLGFGVHEVVHRPDVQTNVFEADNDGPFDYNLGTTATGQTAVSVANAPRGFGFAWSGVDNCANLYLSRYKIIEWRPWTGVGLPAPRVISVGVPPLYDALNKLDMASQRSGEDWTYGGKVAEALGKMGGAALRGAIAGVFAPGSGVAFAGSPGSSLSIYQ